MISHSKKFIFLHIPKCGGCSLHVALKEFDSASTGHLTLEQVYDKQYLSPEFGHKISEPSPEDVDLKEYFVFTFVRNPWDRILSAYNMWKNMKDAHHWAKFDKSEMDFCKNNDFNKFIELVKSGEISRPHTKPVIGHYIKEVNDCDFIGKMENYDEDFQKLLKTLDIPARDMDKHNVWGHDHYSKYYNDQSINIVSELFKDDIKFFEYSFEDLR